MKKSKRPFDWETDKNSSRDLEAGEDDEIIDLDDIIELQDKQELLKDRGEGEELEILDEEVELDFGDLEALESDEDELLDVEFLKNLNLPQDQDALFEKGSAQRGKAESKVPKTVEPTVIVEEVVAPSPPEPPTVTMEAVKVTEEAAASSPADLVAAPVAEPPAKPEVNLDEVVAGIEARLLEAVRGMVESRLPEIVRTVIREEIERLKEESK